MPKIGSKGVSSCWVLIFLNCLWATDGDLHGEEEQSWLLQLGGLDKNEQPSVVEQGKKVGRKRSGVRLSEEEKKERKRQTDARYRTKQKEERKRLEYENTMWKNKYFEATDHSEALSLDELLLVDVDTQIMQAFPFVFYNMQANNNPQRTHSDAVRNDGAISLEQTQILTLPQAVPACCLTFVEKLKRDDRSNVSYSDLKTLLQGETREMEGYRIPLILQPIFEYILASYGDITINSVLGSFSAENVLLHLLVTIKEMGDTSPEQLTGDLILKWKSCILEAQRVKFRVEFATEHLDKIVKYYLSRKVGKRMEELEIEINNLEREKLDIHMFQSQLLLGSQEFQGNVALF